MAFIRGNFSVLASATAKLPRIHSYASGVDNLSAIIAANYFLDVNDMLTPGDFIIIKALDTYGILNVLTNTGTAVTTGNVLAGGSTLAITSSGVINTTAGNVQMTITAPGAQIGNSTNVQINTPGMVPVTVLHSKILVAGEIIVVFSADPSTDTIINYQSFSTS